jgi:predicted MPP superfamily phosphohydrolase
MIILVIVIAIAIYGGVNFWIGLRAWQGLFKYLPHAADFRILYWIVFALIAFSYILGRSLQSYFPVSINRIIAWVGSYWMAALFYLVLILCVFELLRLVEHFLHFIPVNLKGNPNFPLVLGLSIFLTIICILAYGSWNALNPQISRYELTINKKAGDLKDLHIVMVSDIHLGTIHQNSTLVGLVERVNKLSPDLILFAGDVLDENVEIFTEQKMADTFQLLKAKYGVFASLGNHEYIGGHAEEAIKYLGEGGVQVLRDKAVKVADSFYLIGRDDASGGRYRGVKRSDLHPIVESLDRYLPLIVMDHQPSQIEEAVQEKVDLQLSGHTHLGQLWPNQYITNKIFPLDWGLLEKGVFAIVTAAFTEFFCFFSENFAYKCSRSYAG